MPNLRFRLCFAALVIFLGCVQPPTARKEAETLNRSTFATPRLDTLTEQINRNPKDAQAYSNRGYVLALLGRLEEARADLRKTTELKDNGPMHNRVGWAYFNMGDYTTAAAEFEKAAELSNRRAHYDYYSLVLGYWGTGNVKQAIENYHLAVERDPRFGEYKTLNERTAEWTVLERRAIHEIYVLWSKTWKAQ